jgi:hypothetical protein
MTKPFNLHFNRRLLLWGRYIARMSFTRAPSMASAFLSSEGGKVEGYRTGLSADIVLGSLQLECPS